VLDVRAMKLNRMKGIGALPALCVALALAPVGSGCKKELTAEAVESSPAVIVQKAPPGTSSWVVGSTGEVSATLKPRDGKPIAGAVTGDVTFAPPGGTPTTVPVHYEPKTGVLTAAGPKLDADITPVKYALTVDGKPWNGSIDVPRGGTEDLVAGAKLQASLPPNTLGPNGGVLQVVGPDRVELVANKRNGDVRAYVLGPDNQPIDPGDRKITVALEGEAPEVVVLEPQPEAHFFVGHLRTRVDPSRVTLVVNDHGRSHACLVGWSPGTVVVVGPEAPRVHLLAVEGWGGEVELRGHHGHFREGVVVGEPGVVVGAPGVVVEGPSVVVGAPGVIVPGPGIIVPPGPGVLVPAPGVVLGGPSVALGGSGVVRGGAVVSGEVGRGHDHDGDHGHGGGGHHGR
jgi:hypothetical protein